MTKRRKAIDKAKQTKDIKTTDAYSNPPARLGSFTPNLLNSTEYPLTRLTQQYQLMNSLYRSHWIIRRIIDVIPEDMTKNWYKITSQLQPDQERKYTRQERRTKTKESILKGLRWGRLYGGAAGLILLDRQSDMLEESLDYDLIMPDDYKGLLILDRWSGISPSTELITDINDPDFGLPKYYNIMPEGAGQALRVHHSRIVRFPGRDLPNWEEQAETYWGASEIEHVYDELVKRDNTSWNTAQLVFNANIKTITNSDLTETLTVASAKAQQQTIARLEAMAHLLSNMGLLALNSGEEFATHQYTFGGLAEVNEQFMMDVAGAAEMPVTKLFGRSPAGMNATGESDMQNYYDTIESKQESRLQPIIDKLLPIMCISAFGGIPDDIDYKFNPVRRLTDQQRSELGKSGTESVLQAYSQQVISHQIALKELRSLSETTGMWTNITDDDIENASNDIDHGELPGFGLPPNMESYQIQDADFVEGDHPRGPDGKFGSGGGSNEPKAAEELMGTEYPGYHGQEAINKLLQEKKGHIKNAFTREDIGGIDLIWGDDTAGLKHIIKQREKQNVNSSEFLANLSDVIEKGRISKNAKGRFEIIHNGKIAVVSPELRGKEITFLLTAYKTRQK